MKISIESFFKGNKHQKIKEIALLIGIIHLFTSTMTLNYIFILTYFFGENYRSIIDINVIGEAHVELFLLALSFPFGLYCIYFLFYTYLIERNLIK